MTQPPPVRTTSALFARISKIAAGAEVLAGGRLTVNGQVTGDVVVQRGAHLEVNGIVSGRVRCQGGSVVVRGQVSEITADSVCRLFVYGQVHSLNSGGGKLEVGPGAVINGRIVGHRG